MDTWAEFWGLCLPLLTSGIALGLTIARILVDLGVMHR